jgi:hypothetical protein
MTYQAEVKLKVGIKGAFECRNAAGEVIKTIRFEGGEFPIDQLGLTEEQAHALVEQVNGNHHCE